MTYPCLSYTSSVKVLMATAGNRGNKSVTEVIKMVTLVTDRDMLISDKTPVMY